jgi:hypothetical protein
MTIGRQLYCTGCAPVIRRKAYQHLVSVIENVFLHIVDGGLWARHAPDCICVACDFHQHAAAARYGIGDEAMRGQMRIRL